MGVGRGAADGQMFHGLMGGAVFTQANRIMRHHKHRGHTHQRSKAHRRAGIIGKAHERTAIGPHAAMQHHAVHRRCHAMFADAEIDVAAFAVFGAEHAQIGGFGVVGSGQISRSADGFGHDRVDGLQDFLGGRTGGEFGGICAGGFLDRFDHIGQFRRCVTRKDTREFGLPTCGQGFQTCIPCSMGGFALLAHGFPPRFDILGNIERGRCPAIGGLGIGHQRLIRQRAMAFGCILRGRAQGDVRFAGDHRGVRTGLGGCDGAVDINRIMPIAIEHIPTAGGKARLLVCHVRQADLAVNRDAIVIPQHNQTRQLLLACKGQGFLRHTLHQAPIARDDVSVVILHA